MGIVITKEPDPLMLVGNDIYINIYTNDHIIATPQVPGFSIYLASEIEEDNYLTFKIRDNSNNQVNTILLNLPTGTGDEAHIQQIKNYFNGNSKLHHFKILYNTKRINYQYLAIIIYTDEDIFIYDLEKKGYLTTPLINKTDIIRKENYKLIIKLWMYKNQWSNIELEHSLTDRGDAVFKINEILKDTILSDLISLPNFNNYSLSNQNVKYFFEYYSVENGQISAKEKTNDYIGQLGKIPKIKFAKDGNPFTAVSYNNPFLSDNLEEYIPSNKTQFLSFVNPYDDVTITFNMILDGAYAGNQSVQIGERFIFKKYEIITIPIKSDLASNYIDIQLQFYLTPAIFTTSNYKFIIDNNFYENLNEFLYYNKYGVPKILFTKAPLTHIEKFKKNKQEKTLTHEYNKYTFERFYYNTSKTELKQVNTGAFDTKEEALMHKDIFESDFVFFKSNDDWQPCLINKNSLIIDDDDKNFINYAFAIEIAL